jgi:hypothetical protein
MYTSRPSATALIGLCEVLRVATLEIPVPALEENVSLSTATLPSIAVNRTMRSRLKPAEGENFTPNRYMVIVMPELALIRLDANDQAHRIAASSATPRTIRYTPMPNRRDPLIN